MSAVVDFVEDAYDEAVKWTDQAAKDVGKWADQAAEDAGKWTAQAVKDVGNAVDDAFSKDGLLTNFFQDYVPGAGLITSAVHAMAGNTAYAEYAATKGVSTLITAAAAVGGAMLAGPAGAALLAGLAAGVANAWESGMKAYLAASVKNKIDDFSWEGLGTAIIIGGATSAAGAALGKAAKGVGAKLAKGAKGATTGASKGPKAWVKKQGKRAWNKVKGPLEKIKNKLFPKNPGLKKAVVATMYKKSLRGAGSEATGFGKQNTANKDALKKRVKNLKKAAAGIAAVLVLSGGIATLKPGKSGPKTTLVASAAEPGSLNPSDKAKPPTDDAGGGSDNPVVVVVPVAPVAVPTTASQAPEAPESTPTGGDPTPATEPATSTTATTSGTTATEAPTATTSGTTATEEPTATTSGTTAPTTTATTIQQNRAPVANDDTYNMGFNSGQSLFIVRNDTDADGDVLTIVAVTQPGRGRVLWGTGADVNTSPTLGVLFDDGFNSGGDGSLLETTFNYTIEDPSGARSSATVTVRFRETR